MKNVKNTGTLLFLVFASILGTAQEQGTEPVTLERVSNNVYQIKGGSGSNGEVIIGGTGILVIHSKMDEESVLLF